MNMKDEVLETAIGDLYQKQQRKSVGLIRAEELEKFIDSVDELSSRLKALGESARIHKAELVAKTTEREYDSYNWNSSVAYKGPFTLVRYENARLEVIRIDSESEYYMTSFGPRAGITIELSMPCEFTQLDHLLDLLPRDVETGQSYIAAHEKVLNLVVHCPIGGFLYKK